MNTFNIVHQLMLQALFNNVGSSLVYPPMLYITYVSLTSFASHTLGVLFKHSSCSPYLSILYTTLTCLLLPTNTHFEFSVHLINSSQPCPTAEKLSYNLGTLIQYMTTQLFTSAFIQKTPRRLGTSLLIK